MNLEQWEPVTDRTDPRMRAAIDELQDLISRHFPATTYEEEVGFYDDDDSQGIFITATVDTDDTDEVVDIYIDRLIELQLQHGLGLHIVPERTPERIAAYLLAQARERAAVVTGA